MPIIRALFLTLISSWVKEFSYGTRTPAAGGESQVLGTNHSRRHAGPNSNSSRVSPANFSQHLTRQVGRFELVYAVRKLGNFRYILIPEIINKFMTIISDPVRTEHVHVFKLNLK
jgi:hypothetical protein